MKRKDRENAEYIKNKLNSLNDFTELPEELSAESITALVSGKEQKRSKQGKIIAFKTISSVAAAVLLAIGIGSAVNYFNRPGIDKMPEKIEQAQTPVSANTEKTIVDYFTVLRAQYDENRKYDFLYGMAEGDLVVNEAADSAAPEAGIGTNINASASLTDGADHGTTNVQIKGIDEDDIVKNDGKYIYVLTDSSVKIIDAENMKLMSKTDIDSRGSNGMYIYKNYLAVVGYDYSEKDCTVIEIYDIADKAKPKLLNEFSQDGEYFTSRLIGSKVILLSQYAVYPENVELDNGLAVYNDIVPEAVTNGSAEPLSPDMITILPQGKNYSCTYTVMSTIDLDSDEFKPVTSSVLGSGDNVYCTNENLYICDTVYNYTETTHSGGMISVTNHEQTTKIHRFSIKDDTLKSEASGEIKGRMLNQFSIDEKDGYVRVASTDSDENYVFVLDMKLKEVAKIDGIAKGETIQSVRYIGDYGYVVTFRQTDPLFVIDFKDMKAPKIVGELKIPGFSSYLHPFNGYLVGIGTDGDENGTVDALKISLFDIKDPTKPQEIDRFILKGARAESFHKSVMDCAAKDILGFIYRDSITGEAKFCTLRIKEGKINLIGSYSNRSEHESRSGIHYGANGEETIVYFDTASYKTASIERATYIGDILYTVSAHRMCSFPLEGGGIKGSLDY